MKYSDLLQIYFDRSNALQSYWTLYVLVIGGLLAISALRSRPDVLAGILVTVLYLCFAYKNLGAIHDAINQRQGALQAMQVYEPASNADAVAVSQARGSIVPTLRPDNYPATMRFHVICDGLTVLTIWLMQARRYRETKAHLPPAAI